MKKNEKLWIVRLTEVVDSEVIGALQEGFWRRTKSPLNIIELNESMSGVDSVGQDSLTNYCDFCLAARRLPCCRCKELRSSIALKSLGKTTEEAHIRMYQCEQLLTNICVPVQCGERIISCLFSGQILSLEHRASFIRRSRVLSDNFPADQKAGFSNAVEKILESKYAPFKITSLRKELMALAKSIGHIANSVYSARRVAAERNFLSEARYRMGRHPNLVRRNKLYPEISRICHELCKLCGIQYVIFFAEGDPPGTLRPVVCQGPEGWKPSNQGCPNSIVSGMQKLEAVEMARDGTFKANVWQEILEAVTAVYIECCILVRADLAPMQRGVWAFINRSGLPIHAKHFSKNAIRFLEEVVQQLSWNLDVASLVEAREHLLVKFAHEVANPITSIRGIGKELERLDLDDGRRRILLADLQSNCEQAAFLRDSIYDLESEELSLTKTQVKLVRDIIVPCIYQIRERARMRNRHTNNIKYDGLNVIPPLWIDRRRFEQAVINILDNAIKYAKLDTKKCEILVVAETAPYGYCLRFRDWGIGIDPDEDKEIFISGVRGHKSHQYDVTGKGFGLALARKCIEAHGCELQLTRHKDPTEFSITLPYKLENRQ